MKLALTTALLVLGAAPLQAAKDDKLAPIPKEKEGRYGIFTIVEAKEEAAKKKRPIALLVQDDRAEETSEKEAVLKAFWGVQKDTTVVVVASRLLSAEKHRIEGAPYDALTSAEIGKKLPRLAVVSSDAKVVLGIMTADEIMAADEKTYKAFSKKVEDANKNPSASAVTLTPASGAKPATPAAAPGAAPAPAPAAPAAPAGPVAIKDPKPESWTDSQGRVVQATLVEVNGPQVTLQLANGNKVPFDLSKLSDASQKRVQELLAASK